MIAILDNVRKLAGRTSFPEWAAWIAQGKDGDWWAFEKKPRPAALTGGNNGAGVWTSLVGRSEYLCCGSPNPIWQLSLTEIL